MDMGETSAAADEKPVSPPRGAPTEDAASAQIRRRQTCAGGSEAASYREPGSASQTLLKAKSVLSASRS
jgi:hypothetical protein